MWSYFEPEERTWYRWRLDGAEAWLRRDGDEWRTAFSPIRYVEARTDEGGPERSDGPPAGAFGVAIAKGRRAALRPLLPQLPFIVSAEGDFRIHEGTEVSFRLDLPVQLRFQMEGGEALGEFRPFTLAHTWFGDKTDGKLCYALPAALVPVKPGEPTPATAMPLAAPLARGAGRAAEPRRRAMARCDLILRNAHKGQLAIERIAVYSELLRVYDREGFLETDRVAVEGLPDSSLRMSVVPRSPDRRGAVIAEARVGHRELLVRRGVGFLRAIAGL